MRAGCKGESEILGLPPLWARGTLSSMKTKKDVRATALLPSEADLRRIRVYAAREGLPLGRAIGKLAVAQLAQLKGGR